MPKKVAWNGVELELHHNEAHALSIGPHDLLARSINIRDKTAVGFPSPETSMKRPKKNQKKSTKKTRKEKDLPKTPMPRLNRKRVKKDHETKTSRHLFPPPFIRCFPSTDCDRKRYLPLGSKSSDFTLPANAICSANAFSKAGKH